MQRVFLSEQEYKNKMIINTNDLNHLINVMRVKIGDEIEVVYDNQVYLARITDVKEHLSFEILNVINHKEKRYDLTLIQGLAKGDKNDEVITHSVELGVDHIILSEMKYSVVVIKNDKLNSKMERFNKISLAASKQCHRIDLVDVEIKSLKSIDYKKYDTRLLLDEEEAKKDNPRYLNDIKIKEDAKIIFLVGPEGGISEEERIYLIDNGFVTVSLGDNILRTETASLSFLAQLDYKMRNGSDD